jgi:hypothetical protein
MINKRPVAQGASAEPADITRRITELQAAHKALIDELHYGRRPQLSSELLEDVAIAIGTNRIPHKLARKLRGWKQVLGVDLGLAFVSADTTTLTLTATTAGSVSLEVF